MIEHKQCTLPRGAGKLVAIVNGNNRIQLARLVRTWADAPAVGFLTEDRQDTTRSTIYIVDCACRGNDLAKCPLTRLRAWAADNYEQTSIEFRPAVSAARARGIAPRRAVKTAKPTKKAPRRG